MRRSPARGAKTERSRSWRPSPGADENVNVPSDVSGHRVEGAPTRGITSRAAARIPVMHSESALLRAAAAGFSDAVEQLYDCYWPIAWQWAYLITGRRDAADDVAQDAILRAFGALSRFDPERPFRPWLKRIVVNCALSELRRDRRLLSRDGWLDELKPVAESDEDLLAAVRDLSAPRRSVIVLHFWLDMTIDEIAGALGVPFGTAASRLSRGLAELRAALEQHCV